MDKNTIKSNVLQKLIDFMEEKESEGLKSKSPKFMKVETNDPEVAEEALDSAISEPKDDEDDDMSRMMEMMSKKFNKG